MARQTSKSKPVRQVGRQAGSQPAIYMIESSLHLTESAPFLSKCQMDGGPGGIEETADPSVGRLSPGVCLSQLPGCFHLGLPRRNVKG